MQFPEAFELLEVNDHYLSARGAVETDLLNRSDMACLLDAARKYGTMSFGRLKKLSHRRGAYKEGVGAPRQAARGVIQSLEELIVPGRVLRLFCSCQRLDP